MKNIFLIVMSMVFSNLFMMEDEDPEVPMRAHKSRYEKLCAKFKEVKDLTLTNPLIGATAFSAVGYGTHLGIQQLNKKNGEPYFEWLEKHKKKVAIGLSGFSALLGFGTITMMYGEKRELLQSISGLKEQMQEAQEEREVLYKKDSILFSDIEKSLLEKEIIELDGLIKGLERALKRQEDRLKNC